MATYTMPPEVEAMAEAAGESAYEAYTAAVESGAPPAECFEAACNAASGTMEGYGADPGMINDMITAAETGFNNAVEGGADPMQAFDAAGESVESEFGMGPDGPPPGDMAASNG